jgi:tetratricopeptide (TPR) repeat protein
MLRTALGDSSEDLRLLAYSMLDAKEREISKTIHQELQLFEHARQSEGDAPCGPRGLQAARALTDLYAELVYQGVAQGDVRDHAIQQSLHYCDLVLAQRPDNALLLLRRGRLLHLQGRQVESLACYERSLALGMEPARVVPYQAELLFERREFAKAQALMRSLDIEHALPRLKPSIRYWSAS